MVVILIIANLEVEPKPPVITPVHEITKTQDSELKSMLVSIKAKDGYSVETDIADRYIRVTANNANISLEIEAGAEGVELAGKEILKGPGEWSYFYNDNWDPKPGTTTEGNIRKTFFTSKDDVPIVAYQYDYTGGTHDKEIEEILQGVTLFGSHW